MMLLSNPTTEATQSVKPTQDHHTDLMLKSNPILNHHQSQNPNKSKSTRMLLLVMFSTHSIRVPLAKNTRELSQNTLQMVMTSS